MINFERNYDIPVAHDKYSSEQYAECYQGNLKAFNTK